ncbi:MAG: PAS domain S-box protein [Methanoregula sp.]|jgi:PAS domain S-box-containing protein
MLSVLYVDDEPTLLDIGRIFLEMSGHLRIDTASSAGEALGKIKQQNYDGIISDYEMPGINGIEFLRHIRLNYHDLPFILFTGRGREEIAIEALNSGADFYLQKGGEPKSQFVELEYKLNTAIERKRMRDDLRESRQQMSDLIDFLPDATFAVSRENKVISWNRMMEQVTGVPAGAVVGTSKYTEVFSGINGGKSTLVDLLIHGGNGNSSGRELIRDGEKVISELYSQNAFAGKGAHLWMIASPMCDTDGRIIGAIESIRDVTSRKESEEKLRRINEELNAAYEQLTATEEELRQNYDEVSKNQQALAKSEERYRNVVEDQTEFICRFSPDGLITFVNGAYCRYFGMNPDTCIGKPQKVNIPKMDLHRLKLDITALSPEHPVGIIEHRIIMPSGEVRWQRWSDRAVFNKSGRITEYQSVGMDITDQKVAEEELKITHDELNAAYEQLTATEEELRQNYEELSKNQQALAKSEERYRNVVEDQTEFICRFSPKGEHLFVNGAYCRYFGKTREDVIGRKFSPDIPEEDRPRVKAHFGAITPVNPVQTVEHRLRMPDGMIRWVQWTDRGIFDSTGKIIEYQSVGRDISERRHTDLALREANQKLSLLSSITRHDIINQLTALQGYFQLMEEDIVEPGVKELLRKAMRTSEVIRGQISFTQQYEDMGMQTPHWQNVMEIIRDVTREGGFTQVSRDNSLEGVLLFADPLLRQVFYNLFENSLMHGGTVTGITVCGNPAPDGFDLVVADNGRGIVQADKQNIFAKGFGTHTGLGLFLVREILAITGIRIEENGEPGKGARFVIHIPPGKFRKPAP